MLQLIFFLSSIFFVAQSAHMKKQQAVTPQVSPQATEDGSGMTKLLRARCKNDLLELTKRAATILELDESDIIRIGTKQYAASVVYRAPMNHATA